MSILASRFHLRIWSLACFSKSVVLYPKTKRESKKLIWEAQDHAGDGDGEARRGAKRVGKGVGVDAGEGLADTTWSSSDVK